jgi:hypothetical protein
MPRLQPPPNERLAEFEEVFGMVEQTMGFVPNSLLTMAHRPDILRAALRLARDGAVTPNAVEDQRFEELKAHYDAEEIVELVATIAMFGFLNRWNDTLATELEASPLAFAQQHLSGHGWSPGKHTG